MKKTVLLLLAVITLASYTKASNPVCPKILTTTAEVKNQYVKWEVVPKEVKVSWLKDAMQGKTIEGAQVRANANSYKKVWGEAKYNVILSGDKTRFKMGVSKGGEINWAVDANGNPVQSGVLSAGVPLIYFDDQPIAKWGSNGCLNAVSVAQSYANDGEDPDNQKEEVATSAVREQPLRLTSGPNANTNFNSNVFSNDISWNAGYGVYSQGRNDRTADFSQDAMMFMAIQKSAGCNTCPTATTAAPTSYVQPSMYYTATAQVSPQPVNSNGNLDVTVRNKPNWTDVVNTIDNTANTFFNGVNTYRGIRFEQPRGNNVWRNNGGGNPSVRRFNDNNQLGYVSNGSGSGVGNIDGQFGNGW